MSNERNHGKKKVSTAFLLNKLLKEEALPDHLLSPDSAERKKRDAEQFYNEISYISAVEAARIFKETLYLLQNMAKETVKQVNTQDQRYNEYWDKQVAKTYLPQDNGRNQDAKEKGIEFLAVIDEKITAVRAMIVLQKQKVEDLKIQAIVMRNDFIQNWNRNLVARFAADPDFVGIKLPVKMQEQQAYVEINKQAYVELMREIAMALQQTHVSSSMLSDIILQKSTEVVKQIPELKVEMHQEAIVALNNQIWHDVSQNSDLNKQLIAMYETDRAIVVAETKLAMCEKALDSLMDMREVAEKQMNELDSLLDLDRLGSQMRDLDGLLNHGLNSVDALNADSNALLDELSGLQVEAKEALTNRHFEQREVLHQHANNLHNKVATVLDKYTTQSAPEEKVIEEEKAELTPKF